MNKKIIISFVLSALCVPYAQAGFLNGIFYHGASVLPCTNVIVNGKKEKAVILGRERSGIDRGTWCDFGGKRDRGETADQTAAREFSEEANTQKSLGMNTQAVSSYIDTQNNNTEAVVVKNIGTERVTGNPYHWVMYITSFASMNMGDFVTKFNQARIAGGQPKIYQEKDGLAMVIWHDLKAAIEQSPESDTNVHVKAKEFDLTINPPIEKDSQIPLRPSFVNSLRPYITDQPYTQDTQDSKVRYYPQELKK